MQKWGRLLIVYALLAVLVISPVLRGLFFKPQLLPVIILLVLLFVCWLALSRTGAGFSLLDWAVFALGGAYLLSLPGAVSIHDGILECLKIAVYIMVYRIAAGGFWDRQDFRRMAQAVYLAGLLLAVIGLGVALGWIDFAGAFEDGHIRSTLQYHNATAIYMAAAALLGLGLAFTEDGRWRRSFYLAGVYLLCLTVLGTLSRATWVLLPVFLIGYSLALKPELRRQALKVSLIIFTVVLVAGRVMQNAYLDGEPLLALAAILTGGLAAAVCFFLVVYGDCAERRRKVLAPLAVTLLLAIYFGGLVAHPATTLGQYLFADRVIARADQTFTDDTSQMERLVSYRDGLKILRDYPLTGAGGGGWAALYHSYADEPYMVNEMHNYYLKVGIETGIPGLLAVSAVGVLFLWLLYRRRREIISRPDGVLILAAGCAVVIIALHAGMDFELSIPAVALAFFALMGAVRGALLPEPVKVRRWPRAGVVLGAIGVIVIAAGLYGGLLLGEKGAAALEEQQLPAAESYYQRAAKVDPWNAEHRANLARICALQARQQPDGAKTEAALGHAQAAAELAPWQPGLQANLFTTYGLLGRQDLQFAAVTQGVRANPFEAEPYRRVAAIGLEMTWRLLDEGNVSGASVYLEGILSVRQGLPAALQGEIPELELAAGQAALLTGDTASAREYLEPIAAYQDTMGRTARIWLAGARYMEALAPAGNQQAYLNQLQQFLTQEAQTIR